MFFSFFHKANCCYPYRKGLKWGNLLNIYRQDLRYIHNKTYILFTRTTQELRDDIQQKTIKHI